MLKVDKVVKATVEGEAKESTISVNIPANHKEMVKVLGEGTYYKLAVRMLVIDKTNAERVALKGGEARMKRKKLKDLASKLLDDPGLMKKVQEELGIEL